MLIAIPVTAFEVFKRSGLAAFVKFASKRRVFRFSDLVGEGISKKEAYLILRDLQYTEHVKKAAGVFSAENITPTSITVNLRDERCDALFKYAGTRLLLYSLLRGKKIADVARTTGLTERHLLKVKRLLRDLGIIVGKAEVNPKLIKAPVDPIELVPKSAHRRVIEAFRKELSGVPIVFHGDASWGREATAINLLIIHRGLLPPEEQEKLAVKAVEAARKVSGIYEAPIELSFAPMETWIAQKYRLVVNPSPTIQDALEGIFVAGEEPTLEDFFEENMRAVNLTFADLLDMVNKGLVEQFSGRYRFTEKALRRMRRSPSIVVEEEIVILGKRVKLISSKPP